MASSDLQRLVDHLHAGSIDRRSFLRRAAAAGVSLGTATMLARTADAQATPDASPGASPAASPIAGEAPRPITREAYLAQVRQHFGFTDAASAGGEVIMASALDFATLNPVVRSDVASLFLLSNIFNQLATQSVIDGSLVPDLADTWEVSSDYLTYTFHLNKAATWHDGKPVTAADVVFSFEATMDPAGISPFTSNVAAAVAKVEALDDHTVQLTAKEAQAVFLNRSVLLVTIVPNHIWEPSPLTNWGSAPGATGTDPSQVIGSGP
ncbi:MAG: ABC transporter substrate-binding protein, partial [Thermomicrobiales bacterium]